MVLNEDFKKDAYKKVQLKQGFLSTVPERTVRVRVKGGKGFLTIKGIGNESGTTRFEWEKEISLVESEELLKICEPVIIEKDRYYVRASGHVFEVDVFHGENEGLVVAEIELIHEGEAFERPAWLGTEITGKPEYYNASLSRNPFKNW